MIEPFVRGESEEEFDEMGTGVGAAFNVATMVPNSADERTKTDMMKMGRSTEPCNGAQSPAQSTC